MLGKPSVLLFCVLALASTEEGDHVLDGNTFVITNKYYYHANLAQWGTGSRDMGTYEQSVNAEELWVLKEEPLHPGYYYITNAYYNYRIAKWGSGDGDVGVYNGQYDDDQLWKFVRQEDDDVYMIYNKVHSNAKMAKWGKADGDWGTYEGGDSDDQRWTLTPRYEADLDNNEIFHICNRGSTTVTHEKSYTVGITVSNTDTVTTTTGLEVSLQIGIDEAGFEASMSETLKMEITESLSHTETENWSKTTTTTYQVPPGVEYIVTQQAVKFDSTKIPNDDLVQHSSIIRVDQYDLSNNTHTPDC